jgi:site-specific DNA recombinase
VSKRQQNLDGSFRGGIPFGRGGINHLIKNRLYRGEIRHHDVHYPGEHTAIIDAELFEAVQTMLLAHNARRKSGVMSRHPSLLAGMIRDSDDRPMSPNDPESRVGIMPIMLPIGR